MIGLVLVTHGRLAEELRLAMEHVVGPQRAVATVCIGPDDDVEGCRQEIRNSIASVEQGDGVVVLTDILGGTPCNLAVSLADKEHVDVIAGVNLPLLVKLAKIRGSERLADAVDHAAAAGRKYISSAGCKPLACCQANGAAAPNGTGRRRQRRGERPAVSDPEAAAGGAGPAAGDASAMALRRTVRITNSRGLHARAAAKLVAVAERFSSSVNVSRDGETVPACSIMGLMMLGAGVGSEITIDADGWDAKEALEAVAGLVEAGFHED